MFLGSLRPTSLFISTLLLLGASSPLPVLTKEQPELLQLTGANFKDSVASSYWFVEFFSPYCGHCQAFKPTWEKLVASRDDSPRLTLAQVDCIENGDLCNDQKVKYYPFLRLYKDGKEVELFSKDRTLEKLEAFLDEKVPKATTRTADDKKPTEQVVVAPPPKYNLKGQVETLSSEKFQEIVTSAPYFVKFYAPWCHHCQKLAPKWVELAEALKGVANVADVNCDAQSALCTKQGLEGYPTLIFFHNGQRVVYTGTKSVAAMEAFVRKAVAPGVVSVSSKEFESKLVNEDVVFLLLHKEKDTKAISVVEQASRVLLGTPLILQSSDEKLYSKYSIPAGSGPILLTIKDHSSSKASFKLPIDALASQQVIQTYLERNKFPTLTELSMDNYVSVMKNPSNPLVVLAGLDAGGEDGPAPVTLEGQVKKLREISLAWANGGESKDKEREVVFVWMDAVRWGKWLKSMYSIKKDSLPGVVVADHKDLLFYNTDAIGSPIKMTQESIASALRSIYSGQNVPKHSESMIERVVRSLNNKLTSVEEWVFSHVKVTIFLTSIFLAFVFYSLRKCVEDDLPNDYVAEKPRFGSRLD